MVEVLTMDIFYDTDKSFQLLSKGKQLSFITD